MGSDAGCADGLGVAVMVVETVAGAVPVRTVGMAVAFGNISCLAADA